MARFIINKNQQPNGDHEVHNKTIGCSYMPEIANQIDLGIHGSCYSAVRKAQTDWPGKRINGCFYCANTCHTS